MRSQLDAIAPRAAATEKIAVGNGTVIVRGLRARDFVMLRRRFPILKDPAFAAATEANPNNLSEKHAEALIECMPAVIAAGLGEAGNEKSEQLAEQLDEADQARLFNAIMRLTTGEGALPGRPLPNGAAPALVEPLATPSPLQSGN